MFVLSGLTPFLNDSSVIYGDMFSQEDTIQAMVLVYQIGVTADIAGKCQPRKKVCCEKGHCSSLLPVSVNTTIIQESHGQGKVGEKGFF